MNIRPGPRMGQVRGPATPSPSRLQAFLDTVPFAPGGHAPARRRRSIPCRTQLAVTIQPEMSTQRASARCSTSSRARADAARRAHRHHLARRHRLDQSRPLGQPPRPVRAREHGRHLQERAHPLDLQLGVLAEGPAHRARHRRDEPVHPALGARPVAFALRRAAAADRHALRSVHRARPRCAELRLLPGRPLHPGRDAVRHHAGAGRRRAPVDRARR